MPWGKFKKCIVYDGLNERGQWDEIQTHPGKLTENADQAISRDLLDHGMKLADKEGIDIRLHVHDQIVGLAPEDVAEEQLAILQQCMREVPSWAPGLPLGSAGFISPYFKKD
jgi:DNA polymerase